MRQPDIDDTRWSSEVPSGTCWALQFGDTVKLMKHLHGDTYQCDGYLVYRNNLIANALSGDMYISKTPLRGIPSNHETHDSRA